MSRLKTGVLVSFSTAFGLLAYFSHRFLYFPVDLRISLWMQGFNGLLFPIMYAVSFISSPFPATGIVTAVVIWLGRSKRRLEAILTGSATAISVLAIVPTIKLLVDRPRPSPELVQVITPTQGESFPSGHAVYAMVFYGFLFYLTPKLISRPVLAKALQALLVVLIGLTMASRIYLGAHWFSDILGGLFLGGLVLITTIVIYCHYSSQPKSVRGGLDA
jgi:undecaprenyl-diphosphatase